MTYNCSLMAKPFSHTTQGDPLATGMYAICILLLINWLQSTDAKQVYCLLMTPQLVEQLHERWVKLNNFGHAITFDAFFTSKSMHTLTVMWTKNIGACSSIIYNICGFLPQNVTKCISCIASANVWANCIVAGLFVQMLSVLHSSLSC